MSESPLENIRPTNQELVEENPGMVVDFSVIPRLPVGSEKLAYEQMSRVIEIYQDSPDLTLRMQITEGAFNRLQNQDGIKGDGYSRLKEVITEDETEYYLVVSPYTNVSQIKESEDPKQEALTLEAMHYSIKTDDETLNFELTKITAEGVSDVDDRGEIYPKDLIRVELVEKDEAERFISLTKTTESKKEEFKKEPLTYRLLRKIMSPERASELMVGFTMMQIEIAHDMQLYPAKYGMTQNQAGEYFIPQDPPMAKWAMDHIGDIWEISAGFTAMRLGFVAVNEVLKKVPVAKGYQIPDEACFWASVVSAVTVTATHSLGMWAGPYNSHVGQPVPEMIFGQGVAAIVLAATHYTAKYHETIKDLAVRAARFTGKKFKEFDTMMNNFSNIGRPDVNPNIAVNINEQKKE